MQEMSGRKATFETTMNVVFYRICQVILYCIFKPWNRYSVHGSENLPERHQGFIIAANHSSYIDPPVLGSAMRRPLHMVAKDILFNIPVLGAVIRLLGAVPIRAQADFRSLRTLIRILKAGEPVLIFPEGTRAKGSEMGEPAPGVIFLAHMAGVPIIPCFIAGTREALPRGSRILKPKRIRIFLGEPIRIERNRAENRDAHYAGYVQTIIERIEQLSQDAEKI